MLKYIMFMDKTSFSNVLLDFASSTFARNFENPINGQLLVKVIS